MRMSQVGVLVILIVILGVAVTVGMLAVQAPDPSEADLAPATADRSIPDGPSADTRPGAITGEVRIFRTDEPAVDVVVRIEGEDGDARTDEKGLFRLRTPPGGGRTVVVEAPEPYAPVVVTGVTVEPGRSASVGTLYLERAFLVRGEVVDGAGRPIGGAAVRVRRSMAEQVQSGPFDLFLGLGKERPPLESTTADAGGAFSFTKLSPGTFTFEAEARGFAVGFRPRVIVSPEMASRPVRIVLGPGETLEGSVKNGEGAPIAGARITVVRIDEGMLRDLEFQPVQTVTDAEGAFAFANLSPGRAGVMVVADGYPVKIGDEVRVGQQRRLDIVLSGSASVEGTVSDANGKGIEGAEVDGFSQGKSGGFGRTRTDAEGHYRLDHLSEGRFLLMVRKEGYASHPEGADMMSLFQGKMTSLVGGETLRRDVTLQSGSVVHGRVTDSASNRPVAGAEVRVLGAGSFLLMGRSPGVVTDAEGVYRLSGVGTGQHLLLVKATGYVQPGLGGSTIESLMPFGGGGEGDASPYEIDVKGSGLEIQRDLTISPAARITGRVLDPDGRPVPAARVSVDAGDRDFAIFARFLGLGAEPVMTNEEGTFSLASVAGEKPFKLMAEAEGWVAGTSDPVSAPPGADVGGVVIRLGAPGTVEGVVVDEAGAPVVGATVRAATQGDQNREWETRQTLMMAKPVTTDDQGRFRLEGLAPGVCVVAGDAPERVTARVRDVQVVAGSVTPGVVVRLIRGLVIEGDVRDEGGRGISGVQVWVNAERADDGIQMPDVDNGSQTDEDGHFRADRLAPGLYSLRANHDEYVDESLRKVQAGTTGIVITLTRGRSISGRVTMPDGQPAAGLMVSANSRAAGTWEWATTDTNGEFRVDGLKDGTYEVAVQVRNHPGLRGTTVGSVAAGTEGVTLRLEPGFSISGVVVDEAGAPVAGVHVWASAWDGKSPRRTAPAGSGQTDANGRFTIGGLDSGGYQLRAMNPGGPGAMDVVGPTRVMPEPVTATGGTEGVRIVLPAPPPAPEDEGR